MPITDLYISANLSIMELKEIHDMLPDITSVLEVMPEDIKPTYNLALQNTVSRIVERMNQVGTYLSLSGAVESDAKNSLLTPVIAGIPVNPGEATNVAEQTALLADAQTANTNLQTMLDEINAVILS